MCGWTNGPIPASLPRLIRLVIDRPDRSVPLEAIIALGRTPLPILMEAFRQNRRRGAALMLSLWALFLLSAMVISWALEHRCALDHVWERESESRGAGAGLFGRRKSRCIPAPNRVRRRWWAASEEIKAIEARITGEGGRLNIDWVIAGRKIRRSIEVLRKFLEIKGVELNERDQMIDTLLDWVDADNLVRLNGAEEEAGYKAPNKMFTRIEELKKMKGWEEFTSAEDWDADLTLDSQPGTIDLAWASRDVLLALPGTDEMRVDQFLAMRPAGRMESMATKTIRLPTRS